MNSIEMDQNDDCSSDMSGKQLLPTETYAYGLYGELRNVSRVGVEYQTEIPSLITDSEYHDYINDPIQEETKAGVPSDFLIGLDIPIVWISQEVGNMKEAKRDIKIAAQVNIKNEDSTSDFSSEIKNVKNDRVAGTVGSSQLCLVPGCFFGSWTEIEMGSFSLGLYIFEKDFVRLKRFIESRSMGDILSYYYGTFYMSDEYKRWSESRKSRGRRCILGQRIFSGLRQQELLSRLIPHVSQECQNSLLEVSRRFVDGRISFEQYVFSLRTLVGIKSFVDAVAIGRGKQDLTGNAIEPTKQNQAIHIRPEIPIGKACSSLTSTEIIQFLTGDYRLSKARSNDLFWEAVWPRLLARGWHSEQPNGYNYAANGKHSLVFLMPGVKKFSRRLVKGEAYLDSVTDVLNKVASEPQLLELDDCEENGETETKPEEENGFLEKRKSHCYLQPRAPNLGTVIMKFTVVDTSLSGGSIIKLRELEPLNLISRSHSDEVHSELVSSGESGSANTFLHDQETNVNGRKPIKKQKTSNERKLLGKKHLKTTNGSDSVSPEPTKKHMKANLSRKSRQENSGHHAKRRRRLSACSRMDSKAGSSLERDIDDLTDNIHSHVGSSSQANNNNNHKLSSNLSFSSRCSSIETVEEQQQQPQLIDLNYPHVTPEFGNCDFKDERNELVLQKQSASMITVNPQEQHHDHGVSRRQSTRNRPPTARALEALANGFLTVNSRKMKKVKEDSGSRSRSRNSQHSRGEIGVISECSTGDASSSVKGDDENGEIQK